MKKNILICLISIFLIFTFDTFGFSLIIETFDKNEKSEIVGNIVKSLSNEIGIKGNCLKMDYSIDESKHWGGILKSYTNVNVPENYSLTFYVKGDGKTNNLELILIDKNGNNYLKVWNNLVLSTNWQKISSTAEDTLFQRGPEAFSKLSKLEKVLISVYKESPITGFIIFDELSIEPSKPVDTDWIKPYKKHVRTNDDIEKEINSLLSKMTFNEKVGQLYLQTGGWDPLEVLSAQVENEQVGGYLNITSPAVINKLQYVALTKSRLGIPLIFGRDVIHGFKTILPIPLGQAATWNPELIREGTKNAAWEASMIGIKWTFSPMVDIARDPRWGRIAEGLGEDPYLAGILAKAMVQGFQGTDLTDKDSIGACAKHFAGYGAAEAGRDYNTAWIPEIYLRDVYLVPFRYCVEAGVSTLMSSFNEINGIPATANSLILDKILKKEWGFDGFVVSDYEGVIELTNHGIAKDRKEAAEKAINAGLDMEMVSTTFIENLEELVKEGKVSQARIDDAVKRILRIKFRLGLFDNSYANIPENIESKYKSNLKTARKIAEQSIVLLKNENNILPLSKEIKSIAVVGMLADSPNNQLGAWAMDGDFKKAITPLKAIQDLKGNAIKIQFAKGVQDSRGTNKTGFQEALKIIQDADVVLLFLGEDAYLTGEANSRAFLNFPGAQEELLNQILMIGKPVILVIMAGRPLILEGNAQKAKAILYAWHPGTMGGPALADIIFGIISPSGKLPVTFPRTVGQIPIYYSHKNTGRPPMEEMRNIKTGVIQNSLGFKSYYLDVSYAPLYCFGYGLSYSKFEYKDIKISSKSIKMGESINISADIVNTGKYQADEIVQLYVRDLYASITRPVKELKGFKRINLKPGESKTVNFKLTTDDLRFYNNNMEFVIEPGKFLVWIGRDSDNGLQTEFEITEK